MSNTDPAARPEGEAAAPEEVGEIAEPTEREHIVTTTEQTVELQRSVRYGRILIGAAIIGAAVLSLLSLLTPLSPENDYSMPQVVGFMALIGAALGLGIGALLCVVLTAVAKRKHGSGVAIQTDVR